MIYIYIYMYIQTNIHMYLSFSIYIIYVYYLFIKQASTSVSHSVFTVRLVSRSPKWLLAWESRFGGNLFSQCWGKLICFQHYMIYILIHKGKRILYRYPQSASFTSGILSVYIKVYIHIYMYINLYIHHIAIAFRAWYIGFLLDTSGSYWTRRLHFMVPFAYGASSASKPTFILEVLFQ